MNYTPLARRLQGSLHTPVGGDAVATESSGPRSDVGPDVVIQALTESDVIETVRFARAMGLPVRVRATGLGTRFAANSGILLDLSELNSVVISPDSGTATVAGGARWYDVQRAAAAHGLTPVAPSTTELGVAGYLMGGGLGLFARSHGFGSDYLLSARVITGEGEIIEASAQADAEYLWALRGGKLGLGVVTQLTIKLLELPELYCGNLVFDLDDGVEPILRWIDWTTVAPPSLTSSVTLNSPCFAPDQHLPSRVAHRLTVQVAYPGPAEVGKRLAMPLRALGHIRYDSLRGRSLGDMARSVRGHSLTGSIRRGAMLATADTELGQELLTDVGRGTNLPLAGIELRHLAGATDVADRNRSATGYTDFGYALIAFGARPPVPSQVAQEAVDSLHRRCLKWMSPHLTPNWINDVRLQNEIDRSWPKSTRVRLDSLRATHDPTGILWPDRPSGPAMMASRAEWDHNATSPR